MGGCIVYPAWVVSHLQEFKKKDDGEAMEGGAAEAVEGEAATEEGGAEEEASKE